MGFFSDYVTKIVREQTAELAQQFKSASSSKTPKFTIGKLNQAGDSATLPDGTTISIINKGKPGQYTQIYKLGGGLGLADIEEPVYYNSDSAAGAGYVLSFNQSTKILYVRKPGKDAFLYTFDLSPYTLDYASDIGNHYSQLISFSPDGRHICIATAMNTNLDSSNRRVTVRIPDYIYDFNAPFYGIGYDNLVGNGNIRSDLPAFMDMSINSTLNLNTPILRYVILKNFRLIKDSNDNHVIEPESVLTSGSTPLDILTPYQASLSIPPTSPTLFTEERYKATLTSSDTLDMIDNFPPLYCNGFFNKLDTGTNSLFFSYDSILSSEMNLVANQGYWRIRGSWSFTSDSDGEPLLEYYAFAESIKYTYTALINTSRVYQGHKSGSMRIYPQISLDGCGNFMGDFTNDHGWSSTTAILGKLNPSTLGRQEDSSSVRYYLALNNALSFTGFNGYSITWTFQNQDDHWQGVLTRPATVFCAPTFIISDCYPYTHTFEPVLIPTPENTLVLPGGGLSIIDQFGQFENMGTAAWPTGEFFVIPFGQPGSIFPPTMYGGYVTLPGPGGGAFPFPITGNDYVTVGWGFERHPTPLGVTSDIFDYPESCFAAVSNTCLGNDCFRTQPGTTQYPQTYPGQQGIMPLYAKNTIRDSSMVKIDNRGVYTLLNNNVMTENQEIVPENLTGTFGPDILLGTSYEDAEPGDQFYYEVALRHGVVGTYEFTRSSIRKSISSTNPAMLGSGAYYKIFKNSTNTKFAAVVLESNVLETGVLASKLPVRSINPFNFPAESTSCSVLNRGPDIQGGPPSGSPYSATTSVQLTNAPQVWYTSETSIDGQSFDNVNSPTYNPVFTDQVYFPTIPSWLVGALKYRSLDSYSFVKLSTDASGKRVLTKYTYNPDTGLADVSSTFTDKNTVFIPGTIQDVWMPPPRE